MGSEMCIRDRFLTVLADVVWAGIGWLWAKAHHLLPGDTTPDPDPSPSS